jgi:Flp pilus assembly pilin Flp
MAVFGRALIERLMRDERSAIATGHAAIASIVALVTTGLGIILMIVSSQLYEQSSERVLWALAGARAALGV